jgi:ribonucleoside-triphosphate reductase
MKRTKEINCKNASMRKSYVGHVFDKGEAFVKRRVLGSLRPEWAKLHKDGHIHIHDLDAYDITYNCLTFNLLNKFPYDEFKNFNEVRRIFAIFDYYKEIIAKAGNEQSGGMSFANFDCDTAEILTTLKISNTKSNREITRNSLSSLIYWCNNTHERMGQVSYYVTLNIGLADTEISRFICEVVIEEFEKSHWNVFKPNIVFKVKDGVNYSPNDPNFYLFKKALLCTAKKMIPTYVLGDSTPNKGVDINKLAIMGCRTRVVANLYGEESSIGRGNIANITINLPRLALEIDQECVTATDEEKQTYFKEKWRTVADTSTEILLDRYQRLLKRDKSDFQTNLKYDLWVKNFSEEANTLEAIFKNGTLSLGFIGLSETVELLTGKKYWKDESAYAVALDLVKFMRTYCDKQRDEQRLNFSLLATSGEFISGRFPKEDKKRHKHAILEKNFYTNSFHIDVDSKLPAFDKISKEGGFHNFCNGGCITYVELGESPLGNDEGLRELVEHAVQSDVHYLGFNFPLDVCNDCGEKGVCDACINCKSGNITRLRRVSGYLEILDYFTYGKKAEVKNRKRN